MPLCLCEVVQASDVQDAADSRTRRVSVAVLRGLQALPPVTRVALASAWFAG